MATAKKKDISAEIKAANKNLSACLAAGDIAGVAGCYTKTAILMPSNSPGLKGKAIAAFWQGAVESGVKSVTLRTISVDDQGRTANEYGIATLKGARGKILDTAKYVVVWKREGKNWKLHWDIFNSNNPA